MDDNAAINAVESKDILLQRSHSNWSPTHGNSKINGNVDKHTMSSVYSQSQDTNNSQYSFSKSNSDMDSGRLTKVNLEKLNGFNAKEFYKCDLCQELFMTKQALKHHKDSKHNEKKTFRCTIPNCLRAFTSANYLKNHMDIEHSECTDAKIPCPKKGCGMFFPNNYRLKRHIRQDHKQEKLYHCDVCDRKFATVEVRNNHMNTKHGNVTCNENYVYRTKGHENFYRSEQSKESENDTIYASSPISSRLESVADKSGDELVMNLEAAWMAKPGESNLGLSRQIDRILCDIFSDRYKEKSYSPLSSTELAIAIVSLEELNDDRRENNSNRSSRHFESSISALTSPRKNSYLNSESEKKSSASSNPSKYYQTNSQMNGIQFNHQNLLTNGQNYPQSNTESEGHSTESQRSFFVNSSQHEEFSDISMESHLKDVFTSVPDQWSGVSSVRGSVDGGVTSLLENPIKSLDYSCLDAMFDDFHEIIVNEPVNTHVMNGHTAHPLDPSFNNQNNHLQSLNNMHSKFLGGSHSNTLEFPHRSVNVPSNPLIPFSEANRRKLNSNMFVNNNKLHLNTYDMVSPYVDPTSREVTYTIDVPSRCPSAAQIQESRIKINFPPNYSYGSNQMLNSQIHHNMLPSGIYMQSAERPNYAMYINGSSNSNPVYRNSIESDFIGDAMCPTNKFTNTYRRRAPPSYQAAYSHQMLPSQHPTPLSYCPPSMHRSSCFHPHNSRGLCVGLPQEPSPSSLPQQQQQQQRHLLSKHHPMNMDYQGHPTNGSNSTAVSTVDNNPFSECEGSIAGEELSSSAISCEQNNRVNNNGSQNVSCLSSNPIQSEGLGLNKNCDISSAVCM